MSDEFKLGMCTVPDGEKGPWKISTFTLTEGDVMLGNLRAIRDGQSYMVCSPGTYKRLTRNGTVVMSNTPMEVRTNREAYEAATGRVLINGLGMGMLLEAILTKPDVTYVKVVEVDPDVIALVGPHFANDPRVEIVQGDAYEYKPAKGEKYDYIWHDIWDDITTDNLPLMTKLSRKWGRRAPKQGFWSRGETRRMKEQERRYAWW